MNCTIHTDAPAVAYCRTCGTALCAACKRDVRGVIYCENCLAQRMGDVQPPPAPSPSPIGQSTPVVVVSSGPNPGLAAVLAAFLPFGVASVYCGQYAKGVAHMVIFAFLCWGASANAGPEVLFGLGIAFFYVYQIVDAYRTARALQVGQPVPDPFGFSRAFGSGHKARIANVPVGALILIGLGVIFLLANMGVFEMWRINRIWFPVLITGLGVWLFVRRYGVAGQTDAGCHCESCRAGGLMWPALLTTFGLLLLLASLDVVGFHRTWPVLFLVAGVIKILQSNASHAGHVETIHVPPPVSGQTPPPSSPEEVNRVES